MAREKRTEAKVSEPGELNVQETASSPKPGHKLSPSEVKDLESELGVRRQYAVINQEKTEIGEGLYFDDLMTEDPTGETARRNFDFETIVIDLGEQAESIIYDRTIYFHGNTYKVRNYKLDSLLDICYQSRRHDAEVNGRARGLRNVKHGWRMGAGGKAVSGTTGRSV